MAEPSLSPPDDDVDAERKHSTADVPVADSPSADVVIGAEPSPTTPVNGPTGSAGARPTAAVAARPASSADERTEPAAVDEASDRVGEARPDVVDGDTPSPRVDEEEFPSTAPIAAATEPPAPRRRSNRLFATGMVLLSALLFEVVYLAAFALLVSVLSGPQQVVPGLQSLVKEQLVWVPLVLFVVLYELLVLLFNRAGRFVYVVASLVVGAVVFLGSIFIVVPLVTGQPITQDILRQVLVGPEFVLAGLTAREVMLWTGFAIGAHGKRLRRKNREARDEYEYELSDAA